MNSKQKGNNMERDIANYLTRTTGLHYSRSPSSGAFLGGTNNSRIAYISAAMTKTHLGDIIAPDNVNQVIEVKAYASIPWHQIIQGSCKQLDTWIAQLEHDLSSVDSTYIGMLFFKINRQGVYKCLKGNLTTGLNYKEWNISHIVL